MCTFQFCTSLFPLHFKFVRLPCPWMSNIKNDDHISSLNNQYLEQILGWLFSNPVLLKEKLSFLYSAVEGKERGRVQPIINVDLHLGE